MIYLNIINPIFYSKIYSNDSISKIIKIVHWNTKHKSNSSSSIKSFKFLFQQNQRLRE